MNSSRNNYSRKEYTPRGARSEYAMNAPFSTSRLPADPNASEYAFDQYARGSQSNESNKGRSELHPTRPMLLCKSNSAARPVSATELRARVNQLDGSVVVPTITDGQLYFVSSDNNTRTGQEGSPRSRSATNIAMDASQSRDRSQSRERPRAVNRSHDAVLVSLAQVREILGEQAARKILGKYNENPGAFTFQALRGGESSIQKRSVSPSSPMYGKTRVGADCETCPSKTDSLNTARSPSGEWSRLKQGINAANSFRTPPRSTRDNTSIRIPSQVTCASPDGRPFSNASPLRYNTRDATRTPAINTRQAVYGDRSSRSVEKSQRGQSRRSTPYKEARFEGNENIPGRTTPYKLGNENRDERGEAGRTTTYKFTADGSERGQPGRTTPYKAPIDSSQRGVPGRTTPFKSGQKVFGRTTPFKSGENVSGRTTPYKMGSRSRTRLFSETDSDISTAVSPARPDMRSRQNSFNSSSGASTALDFGEPGRPTSDVRSRAVSFSSIPSSVDTALPGGMAGFSTFDNDMRTRNSAYSSRSNSRSSSRSSGRSETSPARGYSGHGNLHSSRESRPSQRALYGTSSPYKKSARSASNTSNVSTALNMGVPGGAPETDMRSRANSFNSSSGASTALDFDVAGRPNSDVRSRLTSFNSVASSTDTALNPRVPGYSAYNNDMRTRNDSFSSTDSERNVSMSSLYSPTISAKAAISPQVNAADGSDAQRNGAEGMPVQALLQTPQSDPRAANAVPSVIGMP